MAQLELVPCPLCRNDGSFLPVAIPRRDDHIKTYGSLYAGKAKSEWKICGRCGFVHQNPRPTAAALNDFYMQGSYHRDANERYDPAKIYESHSPYYEDEIDYLLAETKLKSGRVFDIGCGRGVALRMFRERGWTSYGVEPDPMLCEFGQKHYGLDRVKNGILDGNIRLDAEMDVVFSHHAFEHFADLEQVMAGVKKILKKGGYLFTVIPTYRENRSSMSRLWMNSAHYSLFTHNSFSQLLARHGFEPIAHRYEGWRSSCDQFVLLAKFTGNEQPPERFYEDAEEVRRYLHITNPARSLFYYPRHGAYRKAIRQRWTYASGAAALLVSSPREFLRRSVNVLLGRR